jgi:hypothetical protein
MAESNPGQTPQPAGSVRQTARLGVMRADVARFRIVDTDIVAILRSGRKIVIPDGALKTMLDPDFVISFQDGDVSGTEVMQNAGTLEVTPASTLTVGEAPDGHAAPATPAQETAGTAFSPEPAAESHTAAVASAPHKGSGFLSFLPPGLGALGALGALGLAGKGGGGSSDSPVVLTPVVEIDAIGSSMVVNTLSRTITGTTTDKTGPVLLRLLGSSETLATLDASGFTSNGATTPVYIWTYTFSDADIAKFTQGSNSIRASQTSSAGQGSVTPNTSFTVDTVIPTVGIASNRSGMKENESATITFTFSEDPGSTFTIGDVSVSNGSLGAISGTGLTRTATFTAGTVNGMETASITVNDGSFTDAVGNPGSGGTSPGITVINLSPTVSITSDNSLIKGSDSATVTFTFSRDPGSTFTSDDITVSHGTLSNFSAASDDSLKYTATFTPDITDGTAGVSVAAGTFNDQWGFLNETAANLAITIDSTAPTATLTAGTGPNTGDATVQSTETGTAYLVRTDVTVMDLASITGALDSKWNSVSIPTAGTDTSISLAGLEDGVYKLFTEDTLGNLSSASSSSYTVDTTPPGMVSLALAADTGSSATDLVTGNGTVNLGNLESGGSWKYSTDGGVNWLTGSTNTIGATASVTLTGYGAKHLLVEQQDAVGNTAAQSALDFHLQPVVTIGSQSALLLNGDTTATNTDTLDSVIIRSSDVGELLTLAHLGIDDTIPWESCAPVTVTFDALSNVSIHDATGGNITLADIKSGAITINYAQEVSSIQETGVSAGAHFSITDPANIVDLTGNLNFSLYANTATPQAAIFGDESGFGGQGSANSTGNAGQNGGSGADLLLGTTGSDIIFGDGSGGAGGWGTVNAGNSGIGGGGNDTIFGGNGDDLIFGDGFNAYSGWGGFGGGGGGGASSSHIASSGALGGGAGGNYGGTGGSIGGSSTYGYPTTGQVANGNAGGGGAGVSQDGNSAAGAGYVADMDAGGNVDFYQFNGTRAVPSTVTTYRGAFLTGNVSGAPPGNTLMFGELMGGGADVIHGGAGNDYIMAGNGNDTIYGGQGNDIIYGRSYTFVMPLDDNPSTWNNETFVWLSGDAGTTGAVDIIRDFSNATYSRDHLNISELLQGYSGSNLSSWVTSITYETLNEAGGWDAGRSGTKIVIDVDGAGAGTVTQTIFLTDVDLTSSTLATTLTSIVHTASNTNGILYV